MSDEIESYSMQLEGTDSELICAGDDILRSSNENPRANKYKDGGGLNSSFDSSLLQVRADCAGSSPHHLRTTMSWDERDRSSTSILHPLLDLPDLPPTARRRSLRSVEVVTSAGTPVRLKYRSPGSTHKGKMTPASAKRHKAPILHHPARARSPLHRVAKLSRECYPSRGSVDSTQMRPDHNPVSISGVPSLLRQKRAPKTSWGTHTTAASSQVLETTTDTIESSADTSSETATPFRFASFPASLPRIHNAPLRSSTNSVAALTMQTSSVATHCPVSVRKRMSFGESDANRLHDNSVCSHSVGSLVDDTDGREDEHHFQHTHAEAPLSGGNNVDHSLLGTPAARTRLNFSVSSPNGQDNNNDVQVAMNLGSRNLEFCEIYDARQAGSFASSVSSVKNNSSTGFDDENAFPFPLNAPLGATPLRGPATSLTRMSEPETPREVKLHFQLDAAQCSPIPGIPEEDGDLTSNSGGGVFSTGKHKDLSLSSRLSSSRDSSSSDNSGNCRMARPMPDMTAFENTNFCAVQDHSADDSHNSLGGHYPPSPRLLCPPTPVRTPAWAHGESLTVPSVKPGGLKRYCRSNSLIATKVLATCPPQVLDGRASLESSLGEKSGEASKSLSDEDALEQDEGNMAAAHVDDGSCYNVLSTEGQFDIKLEHESESSHEFGAVVSMEKNFEILSTLGRGTFADVFRVRSKLDSGLYAVKRNRRQFRGTRDRELALAEVKCMQRLQSVCSKVTGSRNAGYSLYILFFYQAWQEDGYFYCQTELCCRDTCRELCDSLRSQWCLSVARYPSLTRLPVFSSDGYSASPSDGRLLPEKSIWKICHDVSAGLSHIHSHHLVHFDIKPSNIFFVPHGRLGAMCKIGDFGMAGEIGSSEDGQEGDQKYMAPELLSSEIKHPSADIFSLGLTLYEIASSLSFVLPSDGARWHDLRSGQRHASSDLPPCRGVDLVSLIMAMLRPSRDERPSADQVLAVEKVVEAGTTCDEFLRDYLLDVVEFDKRQEQQLGIASQEDQTPRHAHSGRSVICSPTVGFLPKPPLLHSPEAAKS